ncbi:hypothetical protein [Cellulomonas carbonis]|uniref:Uncharacterized protein n=1 Tax=Cellulomonas carbonis T26 TaxID=947969 RepID=A0A0A0BS73_9CELL|nr:hypothetical protein [Cellulomonas carbonis]KGM10009.1 hypothetical protein N868_17320 [Cellulomonas carbonis T26]GGB95676.1 hypothetical protein GCM10010972_05500 [Cellulomonas carbonis]
MSEDVTVPIPDEPGQDPDASDDLGSADGTTGGPGDGHGLSDSPHSGYEEEMEADGVGVPAADRVHEGDAPPADLP